MKKILFLLLCTLTTVTSFAQNNTRFDLYISDTDGAYTNVRNAPSGTVVKQLPTSATFALTVVACRNGWFRIDKSSLECMDLTPAQAAKYSLKNVKGECWVHGSVLGCTTMGDGSLRGQLRVNPTASSARVKTRTNDWTLLRPVEMRGKWLKVQTSNKKISGWLPIEEICSNPVTTCN